MKKAQYFSIDAILAAVLMLTGLLLALSVHVTEPETTGIEQYSQDVMKIISSVKLSELNNSYINELQASGQIDDLNKTLLEQAGYLWASNKTENATKLLNITEELIPENIRLGIFFGGDLVYGSSDNSSPSALISSKRLISGIQKATQVKGFSTQVQLSSFNWRSSYSYYYFGGFIGQGNITVRVVLPDNIVNITSAYMELDTSDNFTLSVNGKKIGNFTRGSAGGSYKHADKWFLSNASLGNFTRGVNNVSLNFSGLYSYIGGGFIRIGYKTSDVNDSLVVFSGNNAMQRYYFPQVKGLPNLFDSFFVPGRLLAMTAYLHYNSNYSSFLTIGNKTVWSNQSNFTQFIQLSDSYLSARLDYSAISNRTIPLRLGIVGSNETLPGQGNITADVMLVNDYSGSMEYCAIQACDLDSDYDTLKNYCGTSYNYWLQRSNPGQNCNWTTENYNLPLYGNVCSPRWHVTCPSGDVRRIDILKNASMAFAISMLSNNTGSRMGMVGYSASYDNVIPQGGSWPGITVFGGVNNSIILSKNLTSNLTSINYTINTNMDAYWGTCICCGVRRAREIITAMSNQSRYKAIIIMSDGEANVDCGNSSAKTDAINEAEKACSTYNISVSTVAFGADADAATLKAMVCKNGSFYNASNVSSLIAAYTSFADSMKSSAYSEQVVNVTGGTGEGIIYGDSYLEYNYTPNFNNNFGMIPAELESPRFPNDLSDTTLSLPSGVVLSEVRVTSYSAEKWTDNLTVNNNIAFSMNPLANNYTAIGDPFVVYAPPSLFSIPGNNMVHISTATSQKAYSGGSSDDMIIYKILVPNMAGGGGVFLKADGCTWWNLNFDDGTNITIKIPADYTGGTNCTYQVNNCCYDTSDAIDDAVYRILKNLDIDGDGKLEVKFSEDSLDIKSFTVTGVPSLWGPAVAEVRAWQ